MIFVVPLLWLVVLGLVLYSVFSSNGSSSSEFPSVPSGAQGIVLIGTNYSICTPDGSIISNGVVGTGNFATSTNFQGKVFSIFTPDFTPDFCIDISDLALQYNVFTEEASLGPFYTIISNTKTLQQLIDHYFPASGGWVEDI